MAPLLPAAGAKLLGRPPCLPAALAVAGSLLLPAEGAMLPGRPQGVPAALLVAGILPENAGVDAISALGAWPTPSPSICLHSKQAALFPDTNGGFHFGYIQ